MTEQRTHPLIHPERDDNGANSASGDAREDAREGSRDDAREEVRVVPVKKRRTSGAPRGVASLTPEQLAKKRKNDRVAQRNIRERTKQQIATLERRIEDLTSQEPYRELQALLQEKDAIQAENVEIRNRLSSILNVIQPILGAQNLRDLASAAGPNQLGPATQSSPSSGVNVAYHNERRTVLAATPSSHQSSVIVDSPSPSSYSNLVVGQATMAGATLKSPTTENKMRYSFNALEQQRRDIVRSHHFDGSEERLGFNFLLSPNQHVIKLGDSLFQSEHTQHASAQPPAFSDPYLRAVSTPIVNVEPTCILDGILMDFVSSRQKQAKQGIPSSTVLGPPFPCVASLLNPEMPVHPLSKVLADILSTFPDISGLPEQVAVLYVMFMLMRWQISRTPENYELMPDWITPRATQLFAPHPAWVDYIPWPRLRDRMVLRFQDHPFEIFFVSYCRTLSLSWPYEPTDTLLAGPNAEDVIINPVFERHLRNLDNWSLGPEFAEALPALADCVKIKQTGGHPPRA